MIALSIRQPWAWLILHGGKDIENRSWPTKFRGRVLVHASKGMTEAEYEFGVDSAIACGANLRAMPDWKDMPRGGIVGSVEIIDCVRESASPWFMGEFGFVLRDPQPLPFRPFRGALGFFDVPEVSEGCRECSAGAVPWRHRSTWNPRREPRAPRHTIRGHR